MPGMEKIFSVMIEPAEQRADVERDDGDERDQRVAQSRASQTTLRRGTPLARAVRM